ncbi:MAG: Gfo/Idh/MocA family oxidoreductase [Gammaproteobacteria bacterium]|nr:Gfo/Idh/MocA family oxidoreductase [Gammaproteobacteria bacterium]
MTDNTAVQPKLRLGMVGGGQGAFIGEVHRIAARLDDKYELVAGALSSDSKRAAASAIELGIDADRSYANFEDMAVQEAGREDGIEVATIVTPNHLHYAAASAMLRAGIHVICDKPLTATLAQAEELAEMAISSDLLFAVTYNYSAYPMVRLARDLVAQGRLGDIRIVQVEYPQDWLATNIEDEDQKQALWRTDPEKAGAGGCIGDIGTHAFHLAEFISGLKTTELLADLNSFVGQRKLDDNANILLRFDNGAKGSLWSSQIAIGNENALRIRLYGDKAGIDWSQENPNYLSLTTLGGNKEILSRASASIPAAAGVMTRLPAGHPEGFFEAFANLYSDIAEQLNARKSGRDSDPSALLVPGIADGLRGMQFIEKAVSSNIEGNIWQKLG